MPNLNQSIGIDPVTGDPIVRVGIDVSGLPHIIRSWRRAGRYNDLNQLLGA